MAGYSPLYVKGYETGLVQGRENFILPNDAYPVLENAYVWRERIIRKSGFQLLGRLKRNLVIADSGAYSTINGTNTFNIFTRSGINLTIQPNASIVPGNINTITLIIDGGIGQVLTDSMGTGSMTISGAGPITSATINYINGIISITANAIQGPVGTSIIFSYYPNLPVMGIRIREQQNSTNDQTIFFDQVYAYIYNGGSAQFQEFIPGTTWNAHGASPSGVDFFWSTNYWVSSMTLPGTMTAFFTTSNNKIFWVTNNTGQFSALSDPIRITDGITWVDFTPPNFGQIDNTNFLVQCLAFLPFRGRLLAFNTFEGTSLGNSINYTNRIRWSTIGNPFIPYVNANPPTVPASTGSWRDDIRGQGGFLDIPTSEDIVSVGFVRDNLVIYCERSTWQLRYTGRSIAPFQIERVNAELGVEGTFSSVQFDTSLVGIGDKGIVECDSYSSKRIDIKIQDLVFEFNANNNGPSRVFGIRDFINKLAYWTFPSASANGIFPDSRLLYNYENDSWAIFTDSLTCLGTFQVLINRNWKNTKLPWIKCKFPWISQPIGDPTIVGGNQQGFIETLDQLTVNDISLYISNITGNTTTPTVITSPNHNMKTGFIIQITGIPSTDPFFDLNNGVFAIIVIDANNFSINKFDPVSQQFSKPQLDPPGAFIGVGNIEIRENFNITSKKFNFLEDGQNIQMGYIDVLMDASEEPNPGAVTLNVYLDYNDSTSSNTLSQNVLSNFSPAVPDTFFNATIPTTISPLSKIGGTKFWQRVFCPTRASFLTLQFTLSNAQMAGIEQLQNVQIDAQVLWIRKAGRLTQP